MGRDTPEKQQTLGREIGPMRNSHSCHASTQPSSEDDQGHHQDMQRIFLWCGKDEANDGQCAVAWASVCTSRWAGGLGISDLHWLNYALQARWPWLERTDTSRPWKGFKIKIPEDAWVIFITAVITHVGDGRSALFWDDWWILGSRVQELAPKLYTRIPQRIRASRTVCEALQAGSWASDVGLDIDDDVLQEFLLLWDRTSAI